MKLPKLPVCPASRRMVDVFRGYNQNLRIGEGEFFDMQNLTSDYYPVLSPRKRRGVYARPASPQGLIAKEQLCYVDGADFVVGQERIAMNLSTAAQDCPKQLTSMGAYVIILPDKQYVNTADLTDFGSIEAVVTAENVSVSLCGADGEAFSGTAVGDAPPAEPEDQSCWIDTGGENPVLKRYSAAQDAWTEVAATYVKLAAPGIGAGFRQYDGVTISGIGEEVLRQLNGSAVIWERGEDYILIPGLLKAVTGAAMVTVERRMPEMDFLIESENRLWGCRYGGGINEIYASKLGDFRNWNCFMGLSTDSFAASCGTDGAFTGAVAHLGIPLFFKENCVHKVYGSMPENYQIRTTACRGVGKGSHRSLAIVNETLYYKSRSGICAYDGSLPVEVGRCLGTREYHNAVGGAWGSKYYLSMEDGDGHHLFVYDTARNLWHREDDLQAVAFCAFRGEMYCIDGKERNIVALLGSGEAYEEAVQWMAQTGELALYSPDRKYLSRLSVRLSVEPGTVVELFARYDQNAPWEQLCHIRGTSLQSLEIPVRPRRCDFIQLMLRGQGGMKLYAITETLEKGSDRA